MSNSNPVTSPEKWASIVKNASRTGQSLPSLGPKQFRVKPAPSLRWMATHGVNRHHPYCIGCGLATF